MWKQSSPYNGEGMGDNLQNFVVRVEVELQVDFTYWLPCPVTVQTMVLTLTTKAHICDLSPCPSVMWLPPVHFVVWLTYCFSFSPLCRAERLEAKKCAREYVGKQWGILWTIWVVHSQLPPWSGVLMLPPSFQCVFPLYACLFFCGGGGGVQAQDTAWIFLFFSLPSSLEE